MRGDRLTVDMTTGVSRVESDTGRVQVLLPQGAGSDCSQGAKPGAAPSLQIPGTSKQK
jgi:lipopolysaccharide export system protein LptA